MARKQRMPLSNPELLVRKQDYTHLPKRVYSIEETLTLLPIGRTTLYSLIKSEQLQAVKIGRRTVIRQEEIERFLTTLPKM